MDEHLRNIERLANAGDPEAQRELKHLHQRIHDPWAGIPRFTKTIYPSSRSTAQDDLNDLSSEIIKFISETPQLREYYPDKIAVLSMRAILSQGDHRMYYPDEILYTVGRWRENSGPGIEYYAKAKFSRGGIILEIF